MLFFFFFDKLGFINIYINIHNNFLVYKYEGNITRRNKLEELSFEAFILHQYYWLQPVELPMTILLSLISNILDGCLLKSMSIVSDHIVQNLLHVETFKNKWCIFHWSWYICLLLYLFVVTGSLEIVFWGIYNLYAKSLTRTCPLEGLILEHNIWIFTSLELSQYACRWNESSNGG